MEAEVWHLTLHVYFVVMYTVFVLYQSDVRGTLYTTVTYFGRGEWFRRLSLNFLDMLPIKRLTFLWTLILDRVEFICILATLCVVYVNVRFYISLTRKENTVHISNCFQYWVSSLIHIDTLNEIRSPRGQTCEMCGTCTGDIVQKAHEPTSLHKIKGEN